MITIKTESEFEKMRAAGRIIAEFFKAVKDRIQPGVTTGDLDALAEDIIRSSGGTPSFKGYHGFPGCICASVNNEIVHGIPGNRLLNDGDIIGVDVGAIVEGYHADAARTFAVGTISSEHQKLIDVTRQALLAGLDQVKPGNRISDISHAIECEIKKHDYGIVRQYVGHGIGTELHEEPQIPNFGKPNQGAEIRTGMAFAIEPMVNIGGDGTSLLDDGWTVVTADGTWSAHFENTVLVTENGYEVTTGDA